MTDVKGIEFIKGYKVEKGRCVGCK